MYEVFVDETFAAAHNLRNYKGKCENLHGHNYKVRVTLAGPELDASGLLYDFVHLKQVIHTVIHSLDHKYLNEMKPSTSLNPSAENIAQYIYEEARSRCTRLRAARRFRALRFGRRRRLRQRTGLS